MKILAVDDDPIALSILSKALTQAGYTDLTVVGSAREANVVLDNETARFDCFLLDILMPEIDGIELCESIRARAPYAQTPILMISTVTDPEEINRSFDVGATDFISKPFNGLELGARIRAADILSRQVNSASGVVLEVAALRKALDEKNRVDLDESFEIEGVQGAIQRLELENQLLKMSAGGFSRTVLAFKISKIDLMHAQLSPTAFKGAINAIAGAVWGQISSNSTQFAYCGDGVFLSTSTRPIGRKGELLTVKLNGALASVMAGLNLGLDFTPSIVVGTPLPKISGQDDNEPPSIEKMKSLVCSKDWGDQKEEALRTLRPQLLKLDQGVGVKVESVVDLAKVMTRPVSRALGFGSRSA